MATPSNPAGVPEMPSGPGHHLRNTCPSIGFPDTNARRSYPVVQSSAEDARSGRYPSQGNRTGRNSLHGCRTGATVKTRRAGRGARAAGSAPTRSLVPQQTVGGSSPRSRAASSRGQRGAVLGRRPCHSVYAAGKNSFASSPMMATQSTPMNHRWSVRKRSIFPSRVA